jgi:hypothetical protein
MIEKVKWEKQTVYSKVFEDETSIDTWYYDEEKSNRGPYKIEVQWKNGLDKDWSQIQKNAKQMRKIERNQRNGNSKPLPITQQKWINPKNNKEVGYTRAKMLGLI